MHLIPFRELMKLLPDHVRTLPNEQRWSIQDALSHAYNCGFLDGTRAAKEKMSDLTDLAEKNLLDQ